MDTLTVPQGTFRLARYPVRKQDRLRAWDAADEYLLHELHEHDLIAIPSNVLLVNDGFGALAVPLASSPPEVQSDSFLAHRGIRANLVEKGRAADAVHFLTSLESPTRVPDTVVVKIPKSLAALEDQLHRLRPFLRPGTRILGGAMARDIHTSTLELFERIVGPTRTSLARKKARLIYCDLDPALDPGPTPYPTSFPLEGTRYEIVNHAGVFSCQGLDIGTRLLLDRIPRSPEAARIIDLGCGNGVVGLVAADRNPEAEVVFTDASYRAVESARATFRGAFGESRPARFEVADCLEGQPKQSADLILVNPPFHQVRAIGDAVAWQMFLEARGVLRAEGRLIVVGNRHLAYHTKLKRLFGNCSVLASNRKFVVLASVRS